MPSKSTPIPEHTSPPARPTSRTSPRLLILLLSLLMGLQPVSTDLYLPALPAMSEGFGVHVSQVQLTLSAMLLAFGCSQLFWGPLSDRFGRRPVLLWGMAAYVVAAIGSSLAPSLGWLVVWRMLQGAALGSAVMTARAVVRDLHTPTEGARVMSTALTGLGLIAGLSAPIGGLLTQFFGWRASLAALAIFGAVVLAMIAWRFEETLTAKRLNALHPGEMLRTWLRIGRHPRFLVFSAVASSGNAGLFTYLVTSSFILIRLHGLSQVSYGFCMASMSLCYVAGTLICRRLLLRVGLQRTMDIGAGISLTSGLLLAGLFAFDVHTVWAVVLPMNLFLVGHGINQPCSQNGAIAPFPEAAGTAAALNGFCMMMTAFLVGLWLGEHMDGTELPLVQGLLFWSCIIALVSWVLVRRFGTRASTAV